MTKTERRKLAKEKHHRLEEAKELLHPTPVRTITPEELKQRHAYRLKKATVNRVQAEKDKETKRLGRIGLRHFAEPARKERLTKQDRVPHLDLQMMVDSVIVSNQPVTDKPSTTGD